MDKAQFRKWFSLEPPLITKIRDTILTMLLQNLNRSKVVTIIHLALIDNP
jgi:hypothetical protein